ncbi:MAG: tetratricopeptide repeat protein, partial [Candidatus Brocadiales bacterium]
MIATPSIASLSRPTYSVPDVNRLKKSFPGRPWQSYEEGRKHLQRPEKAKEDFHKAMGLAIKISKKDASSFANFMGVDLGEGRHHREALSFFEKALELDPKYAPVWNNKGLALNNLGRYKEAIEKYQEALRLDRNSPVYHINLAVLLSVTNRHDEAEREFREALRLFKEKEPKRLEEALGYLEKELDTHHDSHSLWRAKAEFLTALGR